jgi:hypothetical protein
MANEPMPGAAADFLDDGRHFQQVFEMFDRDQTLENMNIAISLLGDGIALIPRLQWDQVFPNDLAAFACLIRSYRALRGASSLLLLGYYGEVRLILRSVYESATLSRMLAKEPQLAEKWLRKDRWFPDREVRAWMAGMRTNNPAEASELAEGYARVYRQMSTWAHPTALSCLPLISPDDDDLTRPGLHLSTKFDADAVKSVILEITFAAVFACFAFKNCLVDERAIHPQWRQYLYDFARRVSGQDMPHLERDWEEQQRFYEELARKVQSADHLDDHLRQSPFSWDNISRS